MRKNRGIVRWVFLLLLAASPGFGSQQSPETATQPSGEYEYKETRDLVQLVKEAADLLHNKGEAAFSDFRVPGSRWRQEETYIFVLDSQGNMRVHPDPTMEGKNELDLKDVNGKPIIRGLLHAATALPGKPEGWYHYEWPVPGGLLPRWKSTYVRLVNVPSGASYVVGSGIYNDRMERSFVVDAVKDAVGEIEKNGEAAYRLFHDPKGPFVAKDAYIFVLDPNGVDLVNPAFPNLEGRNILDVKDTQGKYLIREMLRVAQTTGSGWVDYMWPKPGQSVSTQKSAFVSKAKLGNTWVLVGCGVYLADAPKAVPTTKKMTAPELMTLVREAATVFEQRGESAFPEFRTRYSKWFRDDTSYFFVWTLDGVRFFHAADPAIEGINVRDSKDVLGRPMGKMFVDVAATPNGEGWVHYMHPEPGDIFPTWKSSFVKRVTFPSGKQYLIGSGIYNMEMDRAFIEDVVNRAAALVAQKGTAAFAELRDKTGPFVFLDTYIFVEKPDGTELVNAAQPSLEGQNLIDIRDVNGKFLVRDYVNAAMKEGSAWVDYYWYKPGNNTPAQKYSYVKKVQHGTETYILGAGFYSANEETNMSKAITEIQKTSWDKIEKEKLTDSLSRQALFGEKGTLTRMSIKRGAGASRHSHPSEEYALMTTGALKFTFDDHEVVLHAGDILVIPPNAAHAVSALEDSVLVEFFSPAREDWLRGEDQYLRK